MKAVLIPQLVFDNEFINALNRLELRKIKWEDEAKDSDKEFVRQVHRAFQYEVNVLRETLERG